MTPTPSPDAEAIASYILYSDELIHAPSVWHTTIEVGWLCRSGEITVKACQEVFDAIHGEGALDAASACGRAKAHKVVTPTAKKAPAKAAPAKKEPAMTGLKSLLPKAKAKKAAAK